MSDFRTYLDEAGELPADVILGRIVMFTITDTPTRSDDLAKIFDAHNLNPGLLPGDIRAVDAYKKATSDATGVEYGVQDGNTATILSRDVAANSELICRHIVREVRDSRRRQLSHDKVAEAIFYRPRPGAGGLVVRGTERLNIVIDGTHLQDDAERTNVEKVCEDIKARYDLYAHFLDGNKLRATVRTYLKYLNAIELKGGVYFVHSNRTDELLRLGAAVAEIQGCRMNMIPLVDLENERQMVVDAFQREASQALTEIVVEIGTLRATRKRVSPDAYAKIKRKYDSVIAQANEYLRTLGLSQDLTAASAEIALDALAELQMSVMGVTK